MTVRNKKRVGYTYELTIKVKGMILQKLQKLQIGITICLFLLLSIVVLKTAMVIRGVDDWRREEESQGPLGCP